MDFPRRAAGFRKVPLPHVKRMRRSRGIVPYLFRHAEAEPRFHMGQYRAHAADVQGNEDVAHGVQRPGGSGGGTPLHPSQGKRRGRIQTEGITDSEQPQGPRHVQPGATRVQPGPAKLDIYFKSQKLSVFFFIYRVVFLYILSIA